MLVILLVLLAAAAAALARLRWCLRPRAVRWPEQISAEGKCRTLVVLGSGGHTAEMLVLLGGLDAEHYQPLHFIVAATDKTSLPKVVSAYPELADRVTVHKIRRSREVGQSFLSSTLTTLFAAVDALRIVFQAKPQLLLCNGPGTCVPVCFAAFLLRFFSFAMNGDGNDPCLVFVESFCRVKSLSLTGRLLYRVADRFVVQWPELAKRFDRAEYLGTLF